MLASLIGALTSILSGCASAHGATSRVTPSVPPTMPPTPATIVLPSDVTISCSDISASGSDAFLSCQYAGPDNTQMAFYLYVPQGYTSGNPEQQYPLVLILQGGGERANPQQTAAQNRALAINASYVTPWVATGGANVQTRWPCFVVVPQVVGNNRYVNVSPTVSSYALASQPSASLQMAINIVALVQQRYPGIDANRLYITGISMGGFGVWDSIERWPTLFAAAIPVSGSGDPALASRIVRLPLWAFHGANDNRVPVAGSRTMIQALRAAGGTPCYTELAGMSHTIWPQVYGQTAQTDNPLYPWLFAQTKTGPLAGAPACGGT